jgi:hypothetical protein
MIVVMGEGSAAFEDGDHILFTELLRARHCPALVKTFNILLRALREQRADLLPTGLGLARQSIFLCIREIRRMGQLREKALQQKRECMSCILLLWLCYKRSVT